MNAAQICGFILWAVFYGGYLAKLYMGKKKGISVSRMGIGKKALRTRIIEIFLLFFTYMTAAIQLLSVFFYQKWERILTAGRSRRAQTGVEWLGTVIAAAGVLFFLLAIGRMKENWRAGIDASQDTSMVTEGIYRISRNPAFVGFDLFYIGYGILFSNGLMLLFALLGIFTFHMQIREEEKYMEERFGKEYMEYRKKVRRYL